MGVATWTLKDAYKYWSHQWRHGRRLFPNAPAYDRNFSDVWRSVGMVLGGARIGYVLGRSQGAAAQWWMAAGVTPVAAYAPKGAASLAASYTNLANPGTYDAAPGVAPIWDTVTGWTFQANQYLRSFITPTAAYTMIIRYSDISNLSQNPYIAMGADVAYFGIRIGNAFGPGYAFYNGGNRQVAGTGGSVAAVAGGAAYLDGASVGAIATNANARGEIYIGAGNAGGVTGRLNGKIQSIWIADTTLVAAAMAAQSAAMP